MTTVAELIAELQDLPQDAQVVLAKESREDRRSHYSPLADLDGRPDVAAGWHGEWGFYQVGLRQYAGADAVEAVCLWPTN